MKVLFDISVLGIGHVDQKARTGVFRVIENLSQQLIAHPECKVTFCSNLDRTVLQYSIDYWNHIKAGKKISFSKPPFFERKKIWNRSGENMRRVIAQTSPHTLPGKIKRKFLSQQIGVLDRLLEYHKDDLMHPGDIRKADIYHSPYHPIPADISKGKYKSVFLTSYDLIPVLFPQYFEKGTQDEILAVLNSITPDTWVLCISHATRNDLLNYLKKKVTPERVVVTHLAASGTFYPSIDQEKNLAVKRKHHIPDAPYLLSLCTFEPRKNIDQVIKAFARLIAQEKINDLYLVLVGNKGWLFDKIFDELAYNAGLKDRIIVTGFVADADLASIYSEAVCFVYPSFYEGFGLPPLEAMKCGVPVITSDTSSLPEVVGNAGIMVPPTDIDRLCEAMLSVYKSAELRSDMKTRSLEQANKFSWERCGEETIVTYRASLKA